MAGSSRTTFTKRQKERARQERQAEKAQIGFTPIDNAFADVDDVPALQAICDSLGAQHPQALLDK